MNWRTETEVNNYGFDVESKLNNEGWNTLGFVEGYGNSNSPKDHIFEDNTVQSSDTYYYRLKQIDNNGSYEYSKTIEVKFGTPSSTELTQNYPNSFNPSTTISFTLPQGEYVKLRVFNSLGQEIQTIVEGNLNAGIYTYNFDGSGLASGYYIYQLSTSESIQSRKMFLIK